MKGTLLAYNNLIQGWEMRMKLLRSNFHRSKLSFTPIGNHIAKGIWIPIQPRKVMGSLPKEDPYQFISKAFKKVKRLTLSRSSPIDQKKNFNGEEQSVWEIDYNLINTS